MGIFAHDDFEPIGWKPMPLGDHRFGSNHYCKVFTFMHNG